ncbi:hypothetical protein Tco_1204134 [Tanacetum coccineum]
MSSYSIPHGSTSNSNCSTCSKISYDREMQQLRGAAEYSMLSLMQDHILHLLVETLDNPFVAPVNIETIEAFMNMVGYQGVVDKVSAFYTKNLAQPWQTMFKVFNRCLTTRTSGHDQTKINILQMFHAVINQTNVDYAALKFPDIPQRIEEDYHSIKDDIPLVSVYTPGNVLVRGMLVLDAFLTEEICATDDFKEYETVFMNVDVPMNQLGKKGKQSVRESSSPRKTHKITIKKRKQSTPSIKQSTPSIPPLGDDRERDAIAEATLLSLALHKTALAVEAQENVAKVQEKLNEEEIKKWLKIEPESHKEHPEHVTDDDEEIEKEKKDEEVEKEKEDVEIEKEKDIIDDGTVFEELTATISPTIATTSKDSSTTKCKKRYFSHKTKTLPEVIDNCNKVIPKMKFAKMNEMIKEEMPRLVKLVVDKDREVSPVDISDIVSKEFAAHRQ